MTVRRRVVTLAPGAVRPYVDAEWDATLVTVAEGTLELEGCSGRRYRFRTGSVIWLSGLPLRALHGPGPGPTQLVALAVSTA